MAFKFSSLRSLRSIIDWGLQSLCNRGYGNVGDSSDFIAVSYALNV